MDTDQVKNKFKKNIAVWAITPNGKKLAHQIKKQFDNADIFLSKKIIEPDRLENNEIIINTLSTTLHSQFKNYSNHIFIFSTGIAIRLIAPLLDSKLVDPAVVVLDDNGQHAISLLSGHIGGANDLAKKIGTIVNARPVITTATDTNKLPAIDSIAKKANLFIETPENIKRINMAFLFGEKIQIIDPFNLVMPSIPKIFYDDNNNTGSAKTVFCSHEVKPVSRETFIVRPRILSVGMGCNRNTSYEIINNFLADTFKDAGFSKDSIAQLATTDVKKDEKGFLSLSDEMGIEFDFYTKDELNSVTDIQTPSKMVEKHLGVKSVCEAAALLSAKKLSTILYPDADHHKTKAKLILPKQKNKDVTIAVAIIE